MTTSAIIVMIIAIGLFWGGLVVAIAMLRRSPELDDEINP